MNNWLDSIKKDINKFHKTKFAQLSDGQINQRVSSSDRAKNVLPKIRMQKTEETFTKNLILKAHKLCNTWTDVIKYLDISYQAYSRLCKLYGLKELKADRRITTKISKQHNVEVWKLIEQEFKLFDSPKKAADKLQIRQSTIHRLASNRCKKNKGKLNFAEGKDGHMYTFEFTGKKISDGTKREPSKQIKVYKIYEEWYKNYDSIEDANNELNVCFNKQISGDCFQTNGYKIYKK